MSCTRVLNHPPALQPSRGKVNVRQWVRKYNTDKYSTGLISKYENLFDHLKDQKITLLEIGVYYGGSMRYFTEFFTHKGNENNKVESLW